MSNQPERITLLGGAGFLSTHLLRALRRRWPDTALVAVDRVAELPANRRIEGVEYRLGVDLADGKMAEESVRRASVVVNTVGYISFSRREAGHLFALNADLAVAAGQACKRAGVPWLIHLSSVAALGYSGDRNRLVQEDSDFDWGMARRKRKFYMLSKHEGDVLLSALGEPPLLTLVYPGLMLGPGDPTNTPRFLSAVSGRTSVSPPGGTNVVDVRDVADGIVALIAAGPMRGRFILGGENIEFSEMFRRARSELRIHGPLLSLPRCLRRPLTFLATFAETVITKPIPITADNIDSMYEWRYFSSEHARQVFGYKPRRKIEDVFRDFRKATP